MDLLYIIGGSPQVTGDECLATICTNHLREGRLDAETATTVQLSRSMVSCEASSAGPDKVSECPSSVADIFTGKTSMMSFLSLIPGLPPLDGRLMLSLGPEGVFCCSSIHKKPC